MNDDTIGDLIRFEVDHNIHNIVMICFTNNIIDLIDELIEDLVWNSIDLVRNSIETSVWNSLKKDI